MKFTLKQIDASDYVKLYTEIVFCIADARAKKERVILIQKGNEVSEYKFYTNLKKVLMVLKKDGVIITYLKYEELNSEKTAAKYLLNLFPSLKEQIDTGSCGYIIKL